MPLETKVRINLALWPSFESTDTLIICVFSKFFTKTKSGYSHFNENLFVTKPRWAEQRNLTKVKTKIDAESPGEDDFQRGTWTSIKTHPWECSPKTAGQNARTENEKPVVEKSKARRIRPSRRDTRAEASRDHRRIDVRFVLEEQDEVSGLASSRGDN